METKQISLVMPLALLEATKEYSEEYGYRTVQELIIDILRKKIILENINTQVFPYIENLKLNLHDENQNKWLNLIEKNLKEIQNLTFFHLLLKQ